MTKLYFCVIFQSFFAERFFSLFKTDKVCEANSISMRDLCQGLELLTNGSQIEKLQFLFNVYDIDGELHTLVVCSGKY